jgi:hypothetical protein
MIRRKKLGAKLVARGSQLKSKTAGFPDELSGNRRQCGATQNYVWMMRGVMKKISSWLAV